MRPSVILTEAMRNIASGTARALTFAVALAVMAGLLAVADASSIVQIGQRAQQFRDSGSSVLITRAPATVNGDTCDGLSAVPSVRAAGAIRRSGSVTVRALPDTTVSSFEATAAWIRVLGVAEATTPGAFVSSDLASTLGVGVGDEIATDEGDIPVAAVYPSPDDGRDPAYSNAIVLPTIGGSFDECWVRAWPVASSLRPLLMLPVGAGSADEGDAPVTVQLDKNRGTTVDASALLDARPTRYGPLAALVGGVILGAVSIRLRRLEIASQHHAGVRRADLCLGTAVETAVWAVAGAVLAMSAVVIITAGTVVGAYAMAAAAASVVAAVAGAVLGAVAVTSLTRESHLFRYFKER